MASVTIFYFTKTSNGSLASSSIGMCERAAYLIPFKHKCYMSPLMELVAFRAVGGGRCVLQFGSYLAQGMCCVCVMSQDEESYEWMNGSEPKNKIDLNQCIMLLFLTSNDLVVVFYNYPSSSM